MQPDTRKSPDKLAGKFTHAKCMKSLGAAEIGRVHILFRIFSSNLTRYSPEIEKDFLKVGLVYKYTSGRGTAVAEGGTQISACFTHTLRTLLPHGTEALSCGKKGGQLTLSYLGTDGIP